MRHDNVRMFARALLVTGMLLGVLYGSPMLAAEELRLAHFVSPKHPMDRFLMRPWAQHVAQLTNNQLTVRIYPAGELGKGPHAQFKRAADGIADITFGLQGYTSKQFPRTTLIELPAVAIDGPEATEKLWAVYDSDLAPEYRRVKVLALWSTEAPILMTKNKPIRRIADLKGLKIRTPSKAQAKLIQALGATPVPMPATKMYQALNNGVVDALMVPPSVIQSFKINEVAKYYTMGLPFGRSPFFLVMNKGKWEALSPEHKAIIDQTTGRVLSVKGARIYARTGRQALASIRKSGKHDIIQLSAEEVEKGTQLLLERRSKIVAGLEEQGVAARSVLERMGAEK